MAKRTKEEKYVDRYRFFKNRKIFFLLLIPPLTPFGILALVYRALFAPRKSPASFTFVVLFSLFYGGLVGAPFGASVLAQAKEAEWHQRWDERWEQYGANAGYIIARDEWLPRFEAFGENGERLFEEYRVAWELYENGGSEEERKNWWNSFEESGLNQPYQIIDDGDDYLYGFDPQTFSYRSFIVGSGSGTIPVHIGIGDDLEPISDIGEAASLWENRNRYLAPYEMQSTITSLLKEQLARDAHLYDLDMDVKEAWQELDAWESDEYRQSVEPYFAFAKNFIGVEQMIIINLCAAFPLIILTAFEEFGYRKQRAEVTSAKRDLSFFFGKERAAELEALLVSCAKQKDVAAFYEATREARETVATFTAPFAFHGEKEYRAIADETMRRCKGGLDAEKAKAFRADLKAAEKQKDFAKADALIAEMRAALPSPSPGQPGANGILSPAGPSSYDATVLSNFFARHWIGFVGNIVFSILTLGYASLWSRCAKQRYSVEHCTIDGRRLTFDGTPMKLFGLNLKTKILNILTLTIYGRIKKFSLLSWVCRHTLIEGYDSSAKGKFTGKMFFVWAYKWVYLPLNLLTLGIFSPFFTVSREKYFAKHTYYQGVRLKFTGTAASYYKTHMVCWLLNLVTLGIYSPWASLKKQKWVIENTHFDLKF